MNAAAGAQGAYSAYVPCFNNASTIRAAVESILRQSTPPAEVIVVDDGSSDGSISRLASLPVRIVAQPTNLGRGAARARAMEEVRNEFVLCCDATNTLAPDFAVRALTWFETLTTAAVFGRITQSPGGNAVRRWRGRHLYKVGVAEWPADTVTHQASLATYGALVRRSTVLQVGNYAPSRRHAEDLDLGQRLLARGWDVVQDARLAVNAAADNTLAQVLERYWRWNAGENEHRTWREYARTVKYSAALAFREITAGDPAVGGITLLCPHYCFWRSRRLAHRRGLS
jgi:glycosyltransferase involved in cell wall biosynthesis